MYRSRPVNPKRVHFRRNHTNMREASHKRLGKRSRQRATVRLHTSLIPGHTVQRWKRGRAGYFLGSVRNLSVSNGWRIKSSGPLRTISIGRNRC
jgi:hypothetical protein